MILLSSGALVNITEFPSCLKVNLGLREGVLQLAESKILGALTPHFSKHVWG